MKSGLTAIRQVLRTNGLKTDTEEVKRICLNRGMHVSKQMIYNVRAKLLKEQQKKKCEHKQTPTIEMVSMDQVKAAKEFITKAGSINKAKSLIEFVEVLSNIVK